VELAEPLNALGDRDRTGVCRGPAAGDGLVVDVHDGRQVGLTGVSDAHVHRVALRRWIRTYPPFLLPRRQGAPSTDTRIDFTSNEPKVAYQMATRSRADHFRKDPPSRQDLGTRQGSRRATVGNRSKRDRRYSLSQD